MINYSRLDDKKNFVGEGILLMEVSEGDKIAERAEGKEEKQYFYLK